MERKNGLLCAGARSSIVSVILLMLLFCMGITPRESRAQIFAFHPAITPLAPEEVYFDAAGREALQPGVLTSDKFSATSIGDVLTLLFDSARVDLQTQNDALVGSWLGTVRVPTRSGAKPRTSYLQHLRGSVDKTKDTRVVVVVDVGGKTFTTEFPYGIARHGNFTRQFVSPVLKQGNGYTATILIIAERRDPKSAVLVTVDGLDVDAKSGGKSKKD
jgi:hypothetical protein